MDPHQNKPLDPTARYRWQPSGSDDWQEVWIVDPVPDEFGYVRIALYADGSWRQYARREDLFRLETVKEVMPETDHNQQSTT